MWALKEFRAILSDCVGVLVSWVFFPGIMSGTIYEGKETRKIRGRIGSPDFSISVFPVLTDSVLWWRSRVQVLAGVSCSCFRVLFSGVCGCLVFFLVSIRFPLSGAPTVAAARSADVREWWR